MAFQPVQFIGPGALAPADPGVLEKVAERRIENQWGLSEPLEGTLIAVPDCQLLGRKGWLITEAGQLAAVTVVDCENGNHRGEMESRGILADTNDEALGHRRAWMVVR